jgi:hypothetical protein
MLLPLLLLLPPVSSQPSLYLPITEAVAAISYFVTRCVLHPCMPVACLQVEPKGDRVLVKIAEQEQKTRGGILLPVSAQSRPTSGAWPQASSSSKHCAHHPDSRMVCSSAVAWPSILGSKGQTARRGSFTQQLLLAGMLTNTSAMLPAGAELLLLVPCCRQAAGIRRPLQHLVVHTLLAVIAVCTLRSSLSS